MSDTAEAKKLIKRYSIARIPFYRDQYDREGEDPGYPEGDIGRTLAALLCPYTVQGRL